MKHDQILRMVSGYYSDKVKMFGPVARGVDWNSPESQNLRFEQLIKLFPQEHSAFSLLDYGCGYGALLQYLNDRGMKVNYTGYDVSKEMIGFAEKTVGSRDVLLTSDAGELSRCDYVVASGLFNVKEQTSYKEWEQYFRDTLHHIDSLSRAGFSFNVLSDYSDPQKRRDNLYYASPAKLFDYCKTRFSNAVALLHDYPLFEFTILVRKNIQ